MMPTRGENETTAQGTRAVSPRVTRATPFQVHRRNRTRRHLGKQWGPRTGSGPDWSQQLHKVIRPVECLLFGPLNADQASDTDTARRADPELFTPLAPVSIRTGFVPEGGADPLPNKCPFHTAGRVPVALDVQSQDLSRTTKG